jgi:prepilin-type processing-associated H-X9-DG protein/prepilin-type N-terminal cleavage/methylation domain-containing protein
MRDATTTRHRARAFTLVEMLVVMAITAVLISLLLAAIGGAVAAGRSVKCQATQREVVNSFQHFASDEFNEGRGDDESLGRRFRLATFQDQQYGVDEFWRWGADRDYVELPTPENEDPMRCAEVHGDLTLRRGIECMDGAISPAQRMSFGFNRRLHREEYTDHRGLTRTRQVYLNSNVMQATNVPLLWDIDARAAAEANIYPGFSAPSLESQGAYGNDRFWRPALRHNGAMNVAFIDGHVESTRAPLEESWNWGYQFGTSR